MPSCANGKCSLVCALGFKDCNVDPSDGCEAELSNDKNNCGTCGNKCDECSGGRCFKTLATGLDPFDITVDAMNVYVATHLQATVVKIPINGGMPIVLASMAGEPTSIRVDSTNVYWADLQGRVMSIPIAGGMKTTLASGYNGPGRLTIDDANVYWSNVGAGNILSVPKVGGNPTEIANGLNVPLALAVNGTDLFFVERNAKRIRKVPINGGMVTDLSTNLADPYNLAIDGTNVYFTDDALGALKMVPLSGGMTTTLAMNQQYAAPLAIDSTYAYIGSYTQIVRVKLDGSEVTPLVTLAKGFPESVAVDSTSFYYGTSEGTVVKGTPK